MELLPNQISPYYEKLLNKLAFACSGENLAGEEKETVSQAFVAVNIVV